MRVAILHYWFLQLGGGEKVVEALGSLYPQADIFCLFADSKLVPASLRNHRLETSFLDRIPLAHRLNRAALPFYPAAVGMFDFSKYDVVISSDSPPTKAIVTVGDTVHISYTHTPGRFVWDLAPQFTKTLPKLAQPIYAQIAKAARESDYIAAQRVDHFVANSHYIAHRIQKYYRRNSVVIYPPVEASRGYIDSNPDDYYFVAGRMAHNKRIDLAIDACNRLGRRLVIAGTGREEVRLKKIGGKCVEFVGRVSDSELYKLYARCRAFLFPADEDFGIVSVEAQSYGRPVIAYGHGGSLETVRAHRGDSAVTGVYFPDQTVESMMDGIQRFEVAEGTFDPLAIQAHARRFDTAVFLEKMGSFVKSKVEAAQASWANSFHDL